MFIASSQPITLPGSTSALRGQDLNVFSGRACMIAEALSWAVKHNIPLQQALLGLPFVKNIDERILRWMVVLGWACWGPLLFYLPAPWLLESQWSLRIHNLIHDLDNGKPLSIALSTRFKRIFPKYYIVGMVRAEAEGKLETALPVLAEQLNYPCVVIQQRKAELAYVAQKLVFSMLMVGFIGTKVAPQFFCIIEELIGSTETIGMIFSLITIIVDLVQLAFTFLLIILFLPKMGAFGERILVHIPVIGRSYQRFALADLTRGMAAFIRQGDDILSAADWCMKSARNPWIKKRLQLFINQISNGVPWHDAWSAMKTGSALEEWVIRNASTREDPASGFELLAEWLHQQTETETRRMERWIDPVFTIIISVIVALLALTVFYSITTLIVGIT